MATLTYPCLQCGAKLTFAPGQSALKCPYCGSANAIEAASQEEVATAREALDYEAYLARQAGDEPALARQAVKCAGCGAAAELEEDVVSDRCPFCVAPLVSSAARVPRIIVPSALVPFAVAEQAARDAFRKWIGGLWFAPNALRKAYRAERGLKGVYTPYWTYDAASTTPYRGERGNRVFVDESYLDNGQLKTRRVQRTEWWPVSGVVDVRFGDVLVVASRKLPTQHAAQLAPWQLSQLVPYQDAFVSGFRVEAYQVGLAAGFEQARNQMDERIRSAIRADIGGDEQRIHTMTPHYSDVRFKHVLLPVWQSAYRYGEKTYRFLVNGQSGEVQGDRPWSVWKISFAVLLAVLVVGLLYWLGNR